MCIGKSDADRVTPITSAQQAGVDAMINGTKAKLTAAEAQQILKDRPDVLTEYQRASSTADRNSPVFQQKGLDSPENYANYWYTQMGGNREYSFSDQASEQPSPEDQQADLLTSLTKGFEDTLAKLQGESKAQLDSLANLNTSLVGQIGAMQDGFAKSQQELLDQMNAAQAAQADTMRKAIQDMINAQNQTGQKAKTPNYSRALSRNRDLNSGGLGSTMLTGPAGVSNASLTLGRTSLLGA